MQLITRFCGIAALLLFLASLGCQMDSQFLSKSNGEGPGEQALNADENPSSKQSAVNQSRSIKAVRKNDWEAVIPDSQQDELVDSVENLAHWKQVWAVCHPDTPIPVVNFDNNLIFVRTIGDLGFVATKMFHLQRSADHSLTATGSASVST